MTEHKKCLDSEQGRLLAAYEMGLLDDQEQTRFEDHLQDCSACLEQLYEMAPGMAAMLGQPGELAAQLAAATAAEAAWPARPEPERENRLLTWFRETLAAITTPRVLVPVGVAAVLALAMFVQHNLSEPDSLRRLAFVEPVPYVQIGIRAGTSTIATLSFDEGMTHYAAGRYDEAADRLTVAVQLGQEISTWSRQDQAAFYLGLSLLLTGQAEPAQEHLGRASQSPVAPLAEKACWYLAQAHLLLDDAHGALVPLQALADDGLIYRERAHRQLEELRRVMVSRGLKWPEATGPEKP